ncbi:hypothetical protein BST83_11275 [Polaribacter filamentus]|uniref:Secretion system C-terminal sorting domain-containing protein n=1 Tax=Polaribacter filamentus TaxID=53483 RepID=A0A2S7KYI3_9FLAO|nr:T9SS type A sorting domain-containing protein [Polaribacter filamentus]PQB07670.1 hypothetical protein BST83_11275 [Polaribacter filamentus]
MRIPSLIIVCACICSINIIAQTNYNSNILKTDISDGLKSESSLLTSSSAEANVVISEVLLPIEVLGAEGTIEERTITLIADQVGKVDRLWLQVNNLGYENKASIQINDEDWYTLNHNNTRIQSPERERGGMVHGGHNTIRLSIPAQGFKIGLNTLKFRFNMSDAISNGFRVVKLNLLDVNKNNILDASYFEDDEPILWEGPYTDASSIQAGKDLWYNGDLWSNYLEPGKKGFWYGYELKGSEPINAKCASCHTQDGRDLEIFSYSNKSIIERSKFHAMTEEEGKLIASYIRSLSDEKDNVGRYGRPWNPPYQPGLELQNKSIEEWAAGAGLDAVLEADKDMLSYMFPDGVDQDKVYDRFDSDKMVDRTLLPIAIQLPDWKHWLPMVHPMDAYTKDDYWNDPLKFSGNRSNIHPKQGYKDFRAYLEAMPPANRNPDDLMRKNRDFWYHYRFFLAQRHDGNPDLSGHWREPKSRATTKLADGVPRELAATSLARLMGVQFFEIMNEFDLQDKAHWFAKPEDQPATRQWFGENYQIFEIPPHFQACVSENELPINDGYDIVGNCNYFYGQSAATGAYESTNWYHLQLIINGGNGMVSHNSPMDYNYHPDFIMKASSTSGVYEPLRYYHSMNAMYQFRSWSGATTPNDGKGFRIRVQGPWHIIGRSDSYQLNNFSPSIWPTFLDRIEPGLSKWVLNAQLRQFLTEVQKPENNLDNWNRLANGGSNELDSKSKTTSQLKEMTNYTSLYYWADKFYNLFPEFAKLGVDCEILEEMLDWCEEAWPNIDWNQFRSKGELQLSLLTDGGDDCTMNPNTVAAQTTNEGNNPLYEWWVDEEKSSNDTNELDTSNLRPGALVKCRVTSSKNCIANGWVEKEYTLPNESLIVKVRKNSGDWEELTNSIVCTDDVMEFKIDPELQNPLFWLDAMDVSNNAGSPNENSSISEWVNKSSSGFVMPIQTNASLRPIYNTTGMNGLPALMFGTNNASGLELFSTSNDDLLNESWTMFVTGKYYKTPAGDWNAILGNENGDTGLGSYFSRSDGRSRNKFNGSNNYGRPYEDGSDFVLMIAKEGKKVTVYINGKEEESFEGSSANMETNRAFYLGQSANGNSSAGWYHKGPISEVLFYDHSISSNQKKYIEGYLMQKWQFAEDLPSDHTYKENSPLNVNLETPDGETLIFNNNVSTHVVNLDANEKFGDYEFTKSSCSETSILFNLSTTEFIGNDIVKYTINEGRYKVGKEIVVTELDNLELLPNYSIKGDYQWEQPNGIMLAVNENPEKFTVRVSDHLSVWKLHLLQDIASCVTSNQAYDVVINVDELPESEKDDDLDGVKNDIDQCPNSRPGVTVNSIGCFDLPVNNFIIETVGETCLSQEDGSISIKAANTYNYVATINNSETFSFTNDLIIENLSPGDYSMCITIVEEPDYEQCFNLKVDAAKEVTAKSVRTKRGNIITEEVTIMSGTAPYTISINNEETLTTYSRQFEIDVNHGDKLIVSSKLNCETAFVKDIDLKGYFTAYPNPTKDIVNIMIPSSNLTEVNAVIYNVFQQKVFQNTYKLSANKIEISLKNLPTGIYIINLGLDSPVNLKVVKE